MEAERSFRLFGTERLRLCEGGKRAHLVCGLDDAVVIEEHITSAGDVTSEDKGILPQRAGSIYRKHIWSTVKKRRVKKTLPKKGQFVDEARDVQPADSQCSCDGVMRDGVAEPVILGEGENTQCSVITDGPEVPTTPKVQPISQFPVFSRVPVVLTVEKSSSYC